MNSEDGTHPTDLPTGDGAKAAALGQVVEGEARRVLSDEHFVPDPRLLAEGWQRRFMADGVRAEEAMALYRSLGFEVLAQPVKPENVADECSDCRLLMALRFSTIYTRSSPTES
jgi:hypothetical protein